tara:strand:+ start:1976 stop:2149 length:174 start_codon:yes stop_codon:yes gene_type:complete
MKTNNIELTDMWNNGQYLDVGEVMANEEWSPAQVAEFCAYFAKYVGLNELNNLYKFL